MADYIISQADYREGTFVEVDPDRYEMLMANSQLLDGARAEAIHRIERSGTNLQWRERRIAVRVLAAAVLGVSGVESISDFDHEQDELTRVELDELMKLENDYYAIQRAKVDGGRNAEKSLFPNHAQRIGVGTSLAKYPGFYESKMTAGDTING